MRCYDWYDAFVLAVIIGFSVFVGYVGGGISGTSSARNKAIEAGVAEYRCDAQTGDCEFRFITED